MNRYYYIPIPSRYLPRKKNPELDPKLTGQCELIHAVMHSSNRNPFSERSCLSCFGGSSEILSMTYVVLKGYLYDLIDCVRPAVATEPGKVYRKDSSFLFSQYFLYIYISIFYYIRLVLVSDPGSVSPFFCDELLAPVLHFVCGPRRKGAQREEDCTMREARGSTSFKYTTWILAMQCSWALMSIRMNHPFYGGKSLPARQEYSKLQILSLQDMYFHYYEIYK